VRGTTRGEGFTRADIDVGLLSDPKMRRLQRQLLPDNARICRAITVHVACVLSSWQRGERVTAEDAAPEWMDPAEAIEDLKSVGLLDRGARVAPRAWNKWFGEANKRREDARTRWRRANENRAVTSRLPRGDSAVTSPQSVRQSDSQSVRPARVGARERTGLKAIDEKDLPEFLRATQ